MDYSDEESQLRRNLIKQTRHPVMIADDHKFGRHTSIRTFDITTKLTLVTNRPVQQPFERIFKDAGVDVHHHLKRSVDQSVSDNDP